MSHDSDGQDMPRGNVVEWSVDEVADYIDSLGLGQYHEMFLGMCFLYNEQLLVDVYLIQFSLYRECGTGRCTGTFEP